jgi:hypothetical protein
MPRLSENAISFFGAGGHKHDGVSSTLISTATYSLFDFNPGYIGSQSRISIQQTNQTALEEWVMNIVNTKVLAPAGLDLAPGLLSGKSIRANTITATELQANTITADEIAANAVTANELAANLVLVNNVIMSNNYNGTIAANGAITAAGNAGWAITSFGSAEFANTSIRGALVANSVSTPGIDINSDGSISSTNFNVTATGNVTAVNATITGAINASSGSFTGKITVPGTQTQFGTNINDAANYQGIKIGGIAGEWKNAWVERNDGSVYFNAQNPAGTNRFYMDSTDSLLSMGNGAFIVNNAGQLTATSGSIGGSVTIGGTAASTVVNSAANAITSSQVQNNLGGAGITTISGGIINTGTINLNNVNVRTGTSGARINLDSSGLYAYNAAGTQTVKIGSDGSAAFTGAITGSTVTSGDGTDGIQITSDGYLIGTGGSGVRVKNVAGETGTKLFGNLIYTQTLRTNEIDSFDGGDYMRVGRASSTGGFRVKVSEALYDVTSTADKRNVAVNDSNILVTTNLSSIRYKTNVNKLNIDYKKILKLEPVSFLYKKEFLLEGDDETILQYGLIAEEVEKAGLESLVQYNNQNEPNGVDYDRLPVYLLLVCKELQLKIEELESRIQTLEGV